MDGFQALERVFDVFRERKEVEKRKRVFDAANIKDSEGCFKKLN